MATTLDFTIPHLLRDEEEYDAAISEIRALLDADPAPGTKEYERLEFLSLLAEAYEEAHHADLGRSTPQDVVLFMAQQRGMSRGALAALLGGRSRLSDFLNGRRALSRAQIERVRGALGIAADLLL